MSVLDWWNRSFLAGHWRGSFKLAVSLQQDFQVNKSADYFVHKGGFWPLESKCQL